MCKCACVESPHYLALVVVCLPNVIKTWLLIHGYNPYIMFYLCTSKVFHVLGNHCSSQCNDAHRSMFLGTIAHPNVMMHNVKRCILQGIYVGVQIQLKQKLFQNTYMYIIFSVCDWHVKSPASVCCMYAVPNNIDNPNLKDCQVLVLLNKMWVDIL